MRINSDPVRPNFDWLVFPSKIAVIGETGGGKSATAYYLLESRFHEKGIKCYVDVHRKTKDKEPELPEWINLTVRTIPYNAAIIIDDAGMQLDAYDYRDLQRFSHIAELSRHRKSTIILITQLQFLVLKRARGLCDVKIYKRPSLGAQDEELSSMRRMVKMLEEKFDDLEDEKPDEDLRAWSYVVSNKPRWKGWVGPTPLARYWSDELSDW